MLVAPDTSPREARIPGDDASWDFGLGAGFYVDATQAPWSRTTACTAMSRRELPELDGANFPARDGDRQGIFGHSMGGHGALVCALRNPERYRSRLRVRARSRRHRRCPWGQKAFRGYLGERSRGVARVRRDRARRTTRRSRSDPHRPGHADKFLASSCSRDSSSPPAGTRIAARACAIATGYDHSYYFIPTFMADHLAWHASALKPELEPETEGRASRSMSRLSVSSRAAPRRSAIPSRRDGARKFPTSRAIIAPARHRRQSCRRRGYPPSARPSCRCRHLLHAVTSVSDRSRTWWAIPSTREARAPPRASDALGAATVRGVRLRSRRTMEHVVASVSRRSRARRA